MLWYKKIFEENIDQKRHFHKKSMMLQKKFFFKLKVNTNKFRFFKKET